MAIGPILTSREIRRGSLLVVRDVYPRILLVFPQLDAPCLPPLALYRSASTSLSPFPSIASPPTRSTTPRSHYPAYLTFFHAEIDRIGGMETFQRYFLNPTANSGGKGNSKGPRMFTRFMSGVFHPFIHMGFGLEFRDRVVLAEAFAEAAVHPGGQLGSVFPDNWPSVPSAKSHARRRSSQTIDTDASFIDPRRTHVSASNMTGALGGSSNNTTNLTFTTSLTSGYRNLAHASLLEIYTELCSSSKVKLPAYDPDMSINDRMTGVLAGGQGEEIRKIADKWAVTEGELVKSGEADGWARRVEELHVFCTLLAVGTGRKGRETKVDFFLVSGGGQGVPGPRGFEFQR